jgi:hypothetical protein
LGWPGPSRQPIKGNPISPIDEPADSAPGRELQFSKLLVGRHTIAQLLEKGWIERAGSAYRITEGGKAALRAKVQ